MDLLDMMAEPAAARKNDPRTSKAAASDHLRIGTIRHAIVYHLMMSFIEKGHYGMTTGELADKMGVRRDTVSPNMKPLIRMDLVWETEDTRSIPGKYKESMVYIISPKAMLKKDMLKKNPPMKYVRINDTFCPHCGRRMND